MNNPSLPPYVDSHAHLNDSSFNDDRADVIARSFNAGLKFIVEIACSSKEWEPAIKLSDQHKGRIFPVCGIHPQECDDYSEEKMAALVALFKTGGVRALGEIGLDYSRPEYNRIQQREVLEQMLSRVPEGVPLVIHCRSDRNPADGDAYADLFPVIKRAWKSPSKGTFCGVVHCFGGSWDDAKTALDMGFALGLNGTITYPRNHDLRDIARKTGTARLVTETDCPYLPVQSMRGKRNDPSFIPDITAAVAASCGVPIALAADASFANTVELFGLHRELSALPQDIPFTSEK